MDQKIPEPLSKPVESTKPSVNVPPTTPHTAMATSTPLGTPAANVGKSGRGKSLLLTLLILILLGATGTFAYLWQQGKSAQSNLSQAQADKETAEKKLAEAEAKVKELEGVEESSIPTDIVKLPDTSLGFIYEDAADVVVLKTKSGSYSVVSRKVVTTNTADGEKICASMFIAGNLAPGDGPKILTQKKIGETTYFLYQGDGPGNCSEADQQVQDKVETAVSKAFDTLKEY